MSYIASLSYEYPDAVTLKVTIEHMSWPGAVQRSNNSNDFSFGACAVIIYNVSIDSVNSR